MLRAVVLLLLVTGIPGNATADPGKPHVVAVVPNPVADGDRGEYLVVFLPRPTDLGGWTISDGESVARFPNRTASGRIVVTTTPEAVRGWTDLPVLALRGHLALANGGETIRVRDGGHTVDTVRYGRAPEGHRYVRIGSGWRWRPEGATDLPVATARDVDVRAFVLPDSPGVPAEVLSGARERVLLAGYSFTSARIARTLCRVRERGVRVEVLVEAEPVGGMTWREARMLDRLAACGVPVTVLGGEHARYAFHHAKYAVVDDRALVLTENWKPSGTGGRSSRGWGVVVADPEVAAALARTFRADAGWRDGRSWEGFRREARFVEGKPAPTASYPARFSPERVQADRVDVLVAPDNAEPALVDLLDSATGSIDVQQVSIGSPGQPFVRALVRAARRGVRVRVLLSGAWYVADENRALAGQLNERARREGLPLSVRIADPRSRFEKIHAKGVIVDGEAVAVGSLNWNNASARENREVVAVLYGEAVGGFYARVFRADWRGGVWRLPVGLGAVAALSVVLSAWLGFRTIRFENDRRPGDTRTGGMDLPAEGRDS